MANSTLNSPRFLYTRPIMAANKIRLERFGEMRFVQDGQIIVVKYPDVLMNDNWWEWEAEYEKSTHDIKREMNKQFDRIKDADLGLIQKRGVTSDSLHEKARIRIHQTRKATNRRRRK